MARKTSTPAPKVVNENLLQAALASSVANGDIVNLRLLFGSFSPGRTNTSEAFEDPKYRYLQPSAETQADPVYAQALDIVRSPEVWKHIQGELAAQRPAQLPSELVLPLADNALRQSKFTIAAQAYELLRIRRKMQDILYEEARAALDAGEIAAAVRGFRAAAALDYDYSAFPEPLPRVADYQKRALILHARYPSRPEDLIAAKPDVDQADLAIAYLLNDADAVDRLEGVSDDVRIAFAAELVRQVDPDWNEFVERYATASAMTRQLAEALLKSRERSNEDGGLASEIAGLEASEPEAITAAILGREIESGEWWQYLKEIAYEHPAGVLFLCRQLVGDSEVLLPKRREDSAFAATLGLLAEVPVPKAVATADTDRET